MGLFDVTEPKKKEEPRKEAPAPPPVAKAIQFNIQGETKRMMASGDATEFEMSMKVPDDGQPHALVIKVGNHYQIVLEKIKGRDTITVMVETRGEVTPDLYGDILTEIYDMLGFHVDRLDFLPEGTLPRVPGKAVRGG